MLTYPVKMDALDNMTLRKRRDLLFNRAEVPYAYLTSLMFQYVPPPPFAQAPPVAPPVAQQAPQARDDQFRDTIMRALNEARRPAAPPRGDPAPRVITRAQRNEAAIALEALRAERPDVADLVAKLERRQQPLVETDAPRPSGDIGRRKNYRGDKEGNTQ